MIVTAALLTSCVKLLLIPAYKSTDFEVHRNWLAITHTLPVNKWYFENTSEWTLDYPPLFAWFEYILSHIAFYFDKNMLVIEHLNYESPATVLFQRLSVIIADLVYIYGIYRCSKALPKGWHTEVVLPVLLVTNCGLIIVDHIHFQYNGFLYGVLLLSTSKIIEGKFNSASVWFCILLNLKHIYVYLAPAYFVYLLKHHCIDGPLTLKKLLSPKCMKRFSTLGAIVFTVFFVTFLPFYGHLGQVFARMFPFKRGLVHAYWAPNVWAIYNFIDKVAYIVLSKMGLIQKQAPSAVMTGGLVQEYSHSVLPSISPLLTMILTAVMMMPALLKLWNSNKKPVHFLRCVVICALTSFLFGWHVHEKAILMAIIPLSIAAILDSTDAKLFLVLSTVGHFSLFPLLFPGSLLVVKGLLFILYSTYAFHSLSKVYSNIPCQFLLPLINPLETIYLLGLIFVFIYENFIHYLLGINDKLPFLSLLLTSVYCSIGVVYCWGRYYVHFLRENNVAKGNKKVK